MPREENAATWMHALHFATLWSFAIAQPITARNPSKLCVSRCRSLEKRT